MSRIERFSPKNAYADFKVKNVTQHFSWAVKVVESWFLVCSFTIRFTKKVVREFSKFWFFLQIIHRLWWKLPKNCYFHHKRCIIWRKNQKFKNSRISFLVNHIVKLYTKNQLYTTSTAPEKCCVTFFTLKFAYAFLGENRSFWVIFCHFFQKLAIYWPFS